MQGRQPLLDANVTLLFDVCATHPEGDTSRWTVWLGWHAVEKISMAPNGRLKSGQKSDCRVQEQKPA
jgi:hypothetical protein